MKRDNGLAATEAAESDGSASEWKLIIHRVCALV